MVYGKGPQLDPKFDSFTFTYVLGASPGTVNKKTKAVTVAASTEASARAFAKVQLDHWHGAKGWKWC